jgi:hypothetical protein
MTGFMGPLPAKSYQSYAAASQVHPVLPVFYHHFGCAVPTYEALYIIFEYARRTEGVIDMASGSGYWTYMLRRLPSKVNVTAVDNGFSKYRMMWVENTVKADGIDWLRNNRGGEGRVLLLIYAITSGSFTKRTLEAYKGDTVIIVGTQNENRFTNFSKYKIEDWFHTVNSIAINESGPGTPLWKLECRVPLPSFPGKDEALYVWKKGVNGAGGYLGED